MKIASAGGKPKLAERGIYRIYFMVTIFRSRNLKFKINDNDHNPPHVHVEGGGASVRIDLLRLEVMDDHTDFSKAQVSYILQFVREHRTAYLKEWENRHG